MNVPVRGTRLWAPQLLLSSKRTYLHGRRKQQGGRSRRAAFAERLDCLQSYLPGRRRGIGAIVCSTLVVRVGRGLIDVLLYDHGRFAYNLPSRCTVARTCFETWV